MSPSRKDLPPTALYWKSPQPRKGATHPGEQLLPKGYLGYVLGLDERTHCRLVSRLLQRTIPDLLLLPELTQSEWNALHAVHAECRSVIRQQRGVAGARDRLLAAHPEWCV